MLGEENVGRFYVSVNDRMIYNENAVYNNYKILLTIIYVLGDKQVSNFPWLKWVAWWKKVIYPYTYEDRWEHAIHQLQCLDEQQGPERFHECL